MATTEIINLIGRNAIQEHPDGTWSHTELYSKHRYGGSAEEKLVARAKLQQNPQRLPLVDEDPLFPAEGE